MSGGEVAGLIVAVFWAILVSFLAVVLVRLAQTLRQATELVAGVTEQAVPLLGEATAAVRAAHTQLDRVDTITADVQEVTANASALSTTVASTFGGPLVKVAAFGYGVRRAVGLQAQDRKDAKADRRARARAARRTVIVGAALPGARRRTRGKG
ncbi:DUF948 domain-containing protein [Streptomyces sp. PTM05]|uniref:DUF948 domain-containing protein n=1 Tax=Streptantibioticus parmotrematis TaxID=2873249 RepID=A0ABS7QM76_9ACTN|nr:DUF948 domain-containing protein [Streptantibioticus parmotrematis]MBY8884287.1 DUF948 domain-containing protein [Streptantibioticus parmotrematis]